MRKVVVALALTGCGFSSSEAPATDASTVDGETPRDAAVVDTVMVDARPDPFCAGSVHKICVEIPPTRDLMLPLGNLNTASSDACVPYTADPMVDACVIAAATITLPTGKLTVTGGKPLILLANTIKITGNLDGASHRGGSNGPAADGAGCNTNASAPTTGNNRKDGGGGFGGTFGGVGGVGGGGGEDGAAGQPGDTINPTTLRGGCAGSNGAGTVAGGGGHGGGAIALLAKQSISIDGTVNASGGGGGGTTTSAGGGGGGSGGMILLEAGTVTVTGQCFANGGGGGEGANGAADGQPGGDAVSPANAGRGGFGGTDVGGNGGNGSAGNGGPGDGLPGDDRGGNAVGGGGGGGGGPGVIRVVAGTQTGTGDPTKVAPAPK